MNNFLDVNLLGYIGGLEASVGSTMVSYSGINQGPPFDIDDSVPMSINPALLQNYINGDTLGTPFNGFIVSDFNSIEKAATQGLPTTGTDTVPGRIDDSRKRRHRYDYDGRKAGRDTEFAGLYNVLKNLSKPAKFRSSG